MFKKWVYALEPGNDYAALLLAFSLEKDCPWRAIATKICASLPTDFIIDFIFDMRLIWTLYSCSSLKMGFWTPSGAWRKINACVTMRFPVLRA